MYRRDNSRVNRDNSANLTKLFPSADMQIGRLSNPPQASVQALMRMGGKFIQMTAINFSQGTFKMRVKKKNVLGNTPTVCMNS